MSFFPALLSLMAGGLFLTLFRVPYWEIGSRFYKLITYLSLTGWALVLLAMEPAGTPSWILFGIVTGQTIAGFAHLYAIKTARDQLRKAVYWTGFILVLWGILALSIWPPNHTELSYFSPAYVLFVQFALSAGILGAIINAMICGHWYLVNKYLSLEPIESITSTFDTLILAKICIVAGTLGWLYFQSPDVVNNLLRYYPLLVGVRIIAGLMFGWLLNWMAWKTLEYENTQAATGILYACITFVIMGEFSAYYLTVTTGLAL
jgi:hypothetical protein